MLKITTTTANEITTVKLEGKFLSPWIDEVRSACAEARGPIWLDLSLLSYIDLPATEFLIDLMRRGIHIAARSSYVAEVLNGVQL
jgi:hypothetical protein